MTNVYTKSLLTLAVMLMAAFVGFGSAFGYGSSSGSRAHRTGAVLGAETAETNASAACSVYLTTFMRIGPNNNAEEVKKLQTFLNENLGKTIPLTGYFGPLTEAAVKEFQTKYKDEVLTPWNLTTPTGYVFKLTQRKINLLKCPTLTIPMPVL